MNHQAASAAQVAHDVVARYRVAAFCVAHYHPLGAGDRQAGVARLPLAFLAYAKQQACSQRRQPLAEAKLLEELGGVVQAQLLECRFHPNLADFAE